MDLVCGSGLWIWSADEQSTWCTIDKKGTKRLEKTDFLNMKEDQTSDFWYIYTTE